MECFPTGRGALAFVPRPSSKKKRVYGRNMVPPVRSRAARFAVPPGVSAETPAIRRELSPQATEGENSQPVCSGYPALRLRGGERFRACGRGERRPLSTGGKWTERPPGGPCTKGEMPPGAPRSRSQRTVFAAPQPRVCRVASLCSCGGTGDEGRGRQARRTGDSPPIKKPPCLLDKAADLAIMKVEGRCR